MRICDVTLSYTATSGGIRTYIDAKRRYLLEHTPHEHMLIIPGEVDRYTATARTQTFEIASPQLPGCGPYRFFWRPGPIAEALARAQPDVVELGSFYICPWAAFSYRQRRQQATAPCAVAGYFHTDIAEAYVGQPLREAFADWNETVEWLGDRVASVAERGAEKYVGSVFERCDLRMAASPAQAKRLREYGVDDVHEVPLGVDLQLFSPRRRSAELRTSLGFDDSHLVLIYAGRLDSEKHVETITQAVAHLPTKLNARLVLVGEGPLKEKLQTEAGQQPHLQVLPYEQDPENFARLLASADIYVTAGPHETFGLSVVEALAAGLPVVGVAAGALVERVPQELGCLGPVDDTTAFAANIVTVAANHRAMGQRGRQHVERLFGWTGTFSRLLSLYEQTLHRTTMQAC